ncbi:DUF4190 domain-containing protein [Pseudomonas sp. SORT22]|uniref:DUF4190 domain-containing protein n=1 Tax=Pseudomonas sp. SORT22 TaxID=2813842 RepID=UPI001BCB853D|nr:DUF4190 domain-containing protein [Pseudomonas sp. SORT22]QVM96597.1 DUF4190 domain-containing protein [Pseudomonas sp. SORT22]
MAMVFCRGCAMEIHETAPSCPQCGAPQTPSATTQPAGKRLSWMAASSLILCIACVLTLFEPASWDRNTLWGMGLFALTGLVLSSLSLVKKEPRTYMAITGAVLSGVLLILLIWLVM